MCGFLAIGSENSIVDINCKLYLAQVNIKSTYLPQRHTCFIYIYIHKSLKYMWYNKQTNIKIVLNVTFFHIYEIWRLSGWVDVIRRIPHLLARLAECFPHSRFCAQKRLGSSCRCPSFLFKFTQNSNMSRSVTRTPQHQISDKYVPLF
jgi:hypothetical protein